MLNQIPVPELKYYAVRLRSGDVYFSALSDGTDEQVAVSSYDELPEVIKQQMAALDVAANSAGIADVDNLGSRINVGFIKETTLVYWMVEIPSLDYTEVDEYLQSRRNTRET